MQEQDQDGAGKPAEEEDGRSALTAFDPENPGTGEDAASGGDASPDASPEREGGEPDKAAAQCFDAGATGGRPLPYIPRIPFPQAAYRPSPEVQKIFKHTADVVAGPSSRLQEIATSATAYKAIGQAISESATSATAYKAVGLTISGMQKDLASRMEKLAARVSEESTNLAEGIVRTWWKAKRAKDERRLKKWGKSLYEYRVRYGERNEFKATQKAISRYVFDKKRGGVCEGNEDRLGYIESATRGPITLPELFRLADAYEAPPMLIIGETTEDEEKLLELYRKMDHKRKTAFLGFAVDLAARAGAGNEGEVGDQR